MSVVILDFFGASGGVGRCTRELLRQWAAEREPTMLCGQSHVVDSYELCRQTMPDLRLSNLELPKFSLRSFRLRLMRKCQAHSSRLADSLLQETVRSACAWKANLQTPTFIIYSQVVAPPARRKNFCVFLHDLNWRLYPGNFQNPDLTERNCRGWVERASKVIANSECTRDEIIKHYQCDPDKVVAAPLAPFAESVPHAFDARQYLARQGLLTGRFLLFPGVWGLHKGQALLTEAIEMSAGSDPVVVTCGMPLDGIARSTAAVAALRSSLAARWQKLITEKKLVVVGGVADLEMQALRNGCRAYVLPSQYEGYGFPLVEAVYHHRPAIVSDIKPHQEILNRYSPYKLATLYPSDSSRALAAELNRAPAQPAPPPEDWKRQIDAIWSWKNTVQRIHSAMRGESVLTP